MGNPRPTKSKPIKIGRKHTQSESTRIREKKRRALAVANAINIAKQRKYHDAVSLYWSGGSDVFPEGEK